MRSSPPRPHHQSIWRKAQVAMRWPPRTTHASFEPLGLQYTRKTWRPIALQIAWQLLPSIICAGILLAAIVLGLKRQQWALTPRTIGSIEVHQDLQIILLGVINKSMDVVVQAVLEHMAQLYNTVWMGPSGPGATMQDTQMKNEMAKPWVAVRAYFRRRHAVGIRSWGTHGRLLVTLAVSTSVMLLGAGLNTIGWPKQRWYPDHVAIMNTTEDSGRDLTIQSPLMVFERVDWAEDMRAGLTMVGGVPHVDENGRPVMTAGAADEIAGGISASAAFFALTRLPGVYGRLPQDWLSVWDTSMYMTGIQTRITGSTVNTMSVQSQRVVELFDYQRKRGITYARTATGFHGIVQMTVPSLRTTCGKLAAHDALENSIEVSTPDINSASFTVHIGPSDGLSFAGSTCTVEFAQALAPVETWIVDEGAPWIGIHNITAPVTLRPLPISTAAADSLIIKRLAAHFASILPMLHGQVPSFGAVPHLVMVARMLQTQHLEFFSDTAALSAVIATLAQQQLSTAAWTLRAHETILVASAPVHWQMYGSGPRMKWEWIAIVVLSIILCVMAHHISLVVLYKIQPGAWLELGGMLRTAHLTPEGTLQSATRVKSAGSLRDREKVAMNADDLIRYRVQAIGDQWPELIECNDTSLDLQRGRVRHRHSLSTDQSTVQIAMQPRATNNTSATTLNPRNVSPTLASAPSSSSSRSSSPSLSASATLTQPSAAQNPFMGPPTPPNAIPSPNNASTSSIASTTSTHSIPTP